VGEDNLPEHALSIVSTRHVGVRAITHHALGAPTGPAVQAMTVDPVGTRVVDTHKVREQDVARRQHL